MTSQKFLAAFAAISFLIGSQASPCRPISTTSEISTTIGAITETAGATETTAATSLETSSFTEITITESETASTDVATTTETTSLDVTTIETTTSTTEATSTTTSAASPTLLINGDFETGNNAPWTYSGLAANAFIDDSRFNDGRFSFGMGSAASDWVTVVQTLDKSLLVADRPYKLSLYANVESASRCSSGVIMSIDNNNSLQSPFGTSVSVPGADLEASFTYVSGQFTFTEDALAGDSPIRVVIKTKCSNTYTAWVDTVELALAN
ncbi:hypothetical protein NW762_012168 [Fusarium torreyae]|uniref:CBM-cenC domain-containing protein n=1 Tax=Fusarium torreyae TaxID=1237075 RepID=A0A9W8V8P9_9HYPO|nr:hypothetical protein NW762_012168 [Fusarium torreyae]